MDCPVACLGVRTVADLVRLLSVTSGVVLRQEWWRVPAPAAVVEGEVSPHTEHTLGCPLGCLGLSERVSRVLKFYGGDPPTIRALFAMVHSNRLRNVEGIGPVALQEIQAALVIAGFEAGHPGLRMR